MLKTLAFAAAATLALSAPVLAQSANTPAEQGTVTGSPHNSGVIDNGMGEGRAAAPDNSASTTNAARRGATTNGDANGNNMSGGNGQ